MTSCRRGEGGTGSSRSRAPSTPARIGLPATAASAATATTTAPEGSAEEASSETPAGTPTPKEGTSGATCRRLEGAVSLCLGSVRVAVSTTATRHRSTPTRSSSVESWHRFHLLCQVARQHPIRCGAGSPVSIGSTVSVGIVLEAVPHTSRGSTIQRALAFGPSTLLSSAPDAGASRYGAVGVWGGTASPAQRAGAAELPTAHAAPGRKQLVVGCDQGVPPGERPSSVDDRWWARPPRPEAASHRSPRRGP